MGGFRVNGCGVTDHFKKIRSLGHHMCPLCNRVAEFFLEEAKQRIDVLFIPTVTLKSRYAVMCNKCQQGKFCSEPWALQLLQSPAGQVMHIFETESTPQIPDSGKAVPEDAAAFPTQKDAPSFKALSRKSVPRFFKCASCGVTQIKEGDFCTYCGAAAPSEEATRPKEDFHQKTITVCSSCGCPQNDGAKFCHQCGKPLSTDPNIPSSCPSCGARVDGSMSFCMECGKKIR